METNVLAPLPPATMRAWTHVRAGPPSTVLALSSEVKSPTLTSPTDVLVHITHAALNPGGSIMMQLCPFFLRSKPAIPELDFSGVIVAAGSEVPECRKLLPATPVFGSIDVAPHLRGGAGALAEFVVVSNASVVQKPDNVSFEEAAGLGVAGCTALLLIEKAVLKKGDKVLVYGASGGIGTLVVQMARNAVGREGKIVAVCSSRNGEVIKGLGADDVIDYQAHEPVHRYLATCYSKTRFDVIIDAFGVQDLYTHCADYLEPGKPFISVGVAFQEYTVTNLLYASSSMLKNTWWPTLLGGGLREYVCVSGFTCLEALEWLRKMVEEDKLKVVIDSCWDMEDGLKAYDKLLSRRARGKVIVKVQDS